MLVVCKKCKVEHDSRDERDGDVDRPDQLGVFLAAGEPEREREIGRAHV